MVTQPIAMSPATTGTGVASTLSGDFQTFLKMLTTQMQHQDPLEPMAASDFAVQLATFSSVEQQVITNQNLTSISQQLGMQSMAQLASWVGQEARTSEPVWFTGQAVELALAADTTANRAILSTYDSAGNLVMRDEVPTTARAIIWSGQAADGSTLPHGHYTLRLESWRDDTLLHETATEHYAKVLEARGGSQGTRLVLAGGSEVDATQVTALRLAQN